MKILSYKEILELTKNRRAQKQRFFTPEEYKFIVDSCEKDKVLAKILNAYPPQDFESLFKVARERALAAVAARPNSYNINVHDPIFAPGRQATIAWLVGQTKQLDSNIIKRELQTTYKDQVAQTLQHELQNGLIKKLYPRASTDELNEHEVDFRDFIDYIFGHYNDGATGSESFIRALNWSLSPVDAESKNDRLLAFFASLNFGRTSYTDYPEKMVKATSKYSKGRQRNWSCMAGVDERILDGLRLFRLSLDENAPQQQNSRNSSEQNLPPASLEDSYIQSLLHNFVRKTPDSLLPSAELYSAYLQAVLPLGCNVSVDEQQEYRLFIPNEKDSQRILSTIAREMATEQYEKLIEIGKALLEKTDAVEQDSLIALSHAGQRSDANSSSSSKTDYSLITSFFPDRKTPGLLKGALRSLLHRYDFDLDSPLTHETVLDFQEKLREKLYNYAENKVSFIFQQPFEKLEQAESQLAKLNNQNIQLTSRTKKLLAITDSQDQPIDVDDLSNQLANDEDKNTLQEKISRNTGMSQEWLSLLNAVFERKGVELWDTCRNLLEQHETRIVEQNGVLNIALLNDRIRTQNDNLISLGKQHIDEHPETFFNYYATDEELIRKVSILIAHNLEETLDEFLEISHLVCDQATLIKCLELGLWDILDNDQEQALISLLIKNDYQQALCSNHINIENITATNLNLILRNSIKASNLALFKKTIQTFGFTINSQLFLGGGYRDSETVLGFATKCNSSDIVSLLLENKGVNLFAKNRHGENALMIAARHGHLSIFNQLLKKGKLKLLSEKDSYGQTAFMHAIMNEKIEIVSDLFNRYKSAIIMKKKQAITPQVSELIEGLGSAINAKNNQDETPLMVAINNCNYSFIEKIFSTKLLNPNEKDNKGQTALMRAINKGKTDVASLLLEEPRLMINRRDNNTDTALILAVNKSNAEIVSRLLARPDLTLKEHNQGLVALTAALKKGNDEIVAMLINHPEIDLYKKTDGGHNTLYHAISHANKVSYIYMLLQKAGPNLLIEKDNNGRTPLMWAARKPRVEVLSLLLEQKKDWDFNEQDNKGCTVLMYALQSDNEPFITKLLEQDSLNLDLKDKNGKTAFDYLNKGHNMIYSWAEKERHRKIFNLLSDYQTNQKRKADLERLIKSEQDTDATAKSSQDSSSSQNIGESSLLFTVTEKESSVKKENGNNKLK